MKVFVTGYQGRLGKYLVDKLNYSPLECDVTSIDCVKEAIDEAQPDTIVHCAAVTDVDECESDLYSKAIAVNVGGTRNVRSAFEGQMIYMSTDYVFNGEDGPYNEEAHRDPLCHYGFTKAFGEEEILKADYPTDVIIRTTVLYGGHKPDFVTAILEQLKTHDMFKVTGALLGSPTYIPHLAEAMKKLIRLKRPPRIINIAGKDVLSRWGFACLIARVFGYPVHNVLLTMVGQTGVACRPRKAGLKLDFAKSLNLPIYSAEKGLARMRDEQ